MVSCRHARTSSGRSTPGTVAPSWADSSPGPVLRRNQPSGIREGMKKGAPGDPESPCLSWSCSPEAKQLLVGGVHIVMPGRRTHGRTVQRREERDDVRHCCIQFPLRGGQKARGRPSLRDGRNRQSAARTPQTGTRRAFRLHEKHNSSANMNRSRVDFVACDPDHLRPASAVGRLVPSLPGARATLSTCRNSAACNGHTDASRATFVVVAVAVPRSE